MDGMHKGKSLSSAFDSAFYLLIFSYQAAEKKKGAMKINVRKSLAQ
jgi:hypothetical protein